MRLLFLALSLTGLLAAKEDPVQWTLTPANGQSQIAPGGKAYFELKAIIQPGWHLYSPTTPSGGPIITKLGLTANPFIASYQVYRPQAVRKLDPNFQVDTETYTGEATFLIETTASASASGKSMVEATTRYQTCTDVKCLPPVKKTAATDVHFVTGAPAETFTLPAGYALVQATPQAPPQTAASDSNSPPRRQRRASSSISAHRFRLRPGGALHAVRLSDDSDHGLVFSKSEHCGH